MRLQSLALGSEPLRVVSSLPALLTDAPVDLPQVMVGREEVERSLQLSVARDPPDVLTAHGRLTTADFT